MAPARVRYLDLLRVVAIAAVAVGHWLMVDIVNRDGGLSGRSAIEYVWWAGWLTLGFQVIPVFFLVGGYVDARSWPAHRDHGVTWTGWAYGRAVRLLWPTSVYVAAMTAATVVAQLGGVPARVLDQAGWLVALHLWFVPVYLAAVLVTPPMLVLHERHGLRVPLVMAGGAAVVDLASVAAHVPVVGFANYVLVWGAMHQLGFAWQDGRLSRAGWRPVALVGGGAAALAALVTVGPFPLDMIGAGEHPGNTSPPSMALLAFAVAQTGVVLALEPWASRWLARERAWRPVHRLDAAVLTVYLWHMVPVVLVAAAYTVAPVPQPDVGAWQWWVLRAPWLLVLALVLVPVTMAVTRLQRPLLRLDPAVPAGRRAALVTVAALVAMGAALARLAIRGFAPDGSIASAVVAVCLSAFAVLVTVPRLANRPARVGPGH